MTAVDFPTPAPVTPKGLDALAHHFNVVIPEEPTNAAA